MELSLPGGSGMKLASSDATRQQEREYLDTLIEYERLLEDWKETYAPTLQASTWDDRFVEACRMLAPVTYYIDQLCFGYADEQAATMETLTRDGLIDRLRQHMERMIACEQIAS